MLARPLPRARGSFGLEAFKFSLYLLVPLAASAYFNNPENQRRSQDYWKYVTYPANPNTGLKEQLQELSRLQESREAYRNQLQSLTEERQTDVVVTHEDSNEPTSRRRHHHWWAFWRRHDESSTNTPS